MKRLLILFTGLFFLTGTVVAAPATQLKIGVIDVNKILHESPEAKKSGQALEAKFKPRQDQLVSLQEQIKTKTEKLSRDEAILSSQEKDQLSNDITRLKRDLQRIAQDFQQDLNLERKQAMDKFLTRIKSKMDELADKEKYDLILEKNAAPFASAKVDITDKVIKQLS